MEYIAILEGHPPIILELKQGMKHSYENTNVLFNNSCDLTLEALGSRSKPVNRNDIFYEIDGRPLFNSQLFITTKNVSIRSIVFKLTKTIYVISNGHFQFKITMEYKTLFCLYE